MSNKTYVIPDLHGSLDLLMKFLTYGPGFGKLVFLGDYVDRGPDSKKVLDLVFSLPKETTVLLRGNHEDMMIEAYLGNGWATTHGFDPMHLWELNGGQDTKDSFGNTDVRPYVEKLASLPNYYLDEHRIYVHAAVDENKPLELQTDHDLKWARYHPEEEGGYKGRFVVHGHTLVRKVALKSGRVNLDTGAVYSGVLSVGVFDDDQPGGPVEVLEYRRNQYLDS
jgi:serine/threonine protein phosphatase 1